MKPHWQELEDQADEQHPVLPHGGVWIFVFAVLFFILGVVLIVCLPAPQ